MVLQAPPRFHSPGFLGLGVLGTQKKRPFFSSPFPFHSMSMWSFFETGRREWGTLGERVGEEPPPPQVATPLSSIPLLLFLPFSRPFYFLPSSSLCSSISLSRILDHGLWGRSLFSCLFYPSHPVIHWFPCSWQIKNAEANPSFPSYFTELTRHTPPEDLWTRVTLLK